MGMVRGDGDRGESIPLALSYDDVLLVPQRSSVRSRRDVTTSARFTRRISLGIPIVSANMDTVTEVSMALAMARAGGIGVIHRFLGIRDQAALVERAKSPYRLVVRDVHTIRPDRTIADARSAMQRHDVTSLLVVDEQRHVLGIITLRDVLPAADDARPVTTIMTTGSGLVTAPAGTSYQEAVRLLYEHRVEKLPLVDDGGRLVGLLVMRDLLDEVQHPGASRDSGGRPLVAAAVGVVGDFRERAQTLVEAGCDALVVDVAHGHSEHTIAAVRTLKGDHPSVDLVAGNVATAEGTIDLIEAGADGVKVGVGPGAACTTRIVTGFGVPQLTAVLECSAAASRYGVPVIADGGIRAAGDVVKALAAGADTAMVGSLLAGTEESPGTTVRRHGNLFKVYRGMASRGATLDRRRRERDLTEDDELLEEGSVVPEGVEALVPHAGPVAGVLRQLVGGVRSGMSYCGAHTIPELRERARFVRVTEAGLRESRPHDLVPG